MLWPWRLSTRQSSCFGITPPTVYIQLSCFNLLLSRPMGVDYVVIGFDMEVQSLATHNAA